jgi:hypothetical protein
MVWEDCCTSGTKLGSRNVESFATELISRVLVSKPSKLLVLKSPNAKYDNNSGCLRSVPFLSFILLVYSFVELVNP